MYTAGATGEFEIPGTGLLPDEPDKLKLLVTDLARILQNALHTIEAQKQTTLRANINAETTRLRFVDVYRQLNLEIAKNATLTRQRSLEEEARRYEKTKLAAEKLHEDFRLATIDHQISGSSREPMRISKLHARIDLIESKQDSQKLLLRQLGRAQELTEDVCAAAQVGDLTTLASLLSTGGNSVGGGGRGVDIHCIDSVGFQPLHYAVANGHVEVVRYLLEAGCDPTCYLSGHSSMEIAARFGQIEVG
jgi:hypothetical protein